MTSLRRLLTEGLQRPRSIGVGARPFLPSVVGCIAVHRLVNLGRRKLEMVEPGQEASRPSTHASAHRKEIHRLKQLLAEKTLEVDFFKGALQKIEARRQRNSGSGEMTSTTRSEK